MIELLKEAEMMEPRYAATNRRDETVYTMPLPEGESIDIAFRFANRGVLEEEAPDSYRDIDIDFVLDVCGEGDEVQATVTLSKDELVTLQKILTKALEHSTVRRFQWFADALSQHGDTSDTRAAAAEA